MASLALSLSSCSEKTEAGEYDNWQSRNAAFVDSIAQVCARNADGNWQRFCAYNLNDSVEALAPNNQHYIYVHKIEKGTSDNKPLFNDSVRVHYLGRLIPTSSRPEGTVFDKSYGSNVFNELTDVPALFGTSGLVVGFSTALLNMTEGERWCVYIPSYLGYGSGSSGSIPAFSTLIFDIKLAKIYKYKVDTNTSWH